MKSQFAWLKNIKIFFFLIFFILYIKLLFYSTYKSKWTCFKNDFKSQYLQWNSRYSMLRETHWFFGRGVCFKWRAGAPPLPLRPINKSIDLRRQQCMLAQAPTANCIALFSPAVFQKTRRRAAEMIWILSHKYLEYVSPHWVASGDIISTSCLVRPLPTHTMQF